MVHGFKAQDDSNIIYTSYIEYAIRYLLKNLSRLYAESISAWSNQGLVMCLLSILNQ